MSLIHADMSMSAQRKRPDRDSLDPSPPSQKIDQETVRHETSLTSPTERRPERPLQNRLETMENQLAEAADRWSGVLNTIPRSLPHSIDSQHDKDKCAILISILAAYRTSYTTQSEQAILHICNLI